MPVAFIFINAEAGSEDEVLEGLRKIADVKEAYTVYGAYDIVAKVEAETSDKLRKVIVQKVREVGGIRSTLTMLAMGERWASPCPASMH